MIHGHRLLVQKDNQTTLYHAFANLIASYMFVSQPRGCLTEDSIQGRWIQKLLEANLAIAQGLIKGIGFVAIEGERKVLAMKLEKTLLIGGFLDNSKDCKALEHFWINRGKHG